MIRAANGLIIAQDGHTCSVDLWVYSCLVFLEAHNGSWPPFAEAHAQYSSATYDLANYNIRLVCALAMECFYI